MSKYQPTIGLEIHVQLKTKTKMFCGCLNDFQEKRPNINICPTCTGQPGTLPVINKKAVKMVIKTGLALNCSIAEESFFERKNYFYPDLPKGYQISQYKIPLCANGKLKIDDREIRIRRIHLEEDTGKLIHSKENFSLVDFNRAGVPLMELVTEPDICSSKEARKFAQELQLILRYLGVSDADMEKGQMRVEANVSLRNKNQRAEKKQVLGTKVEIKNLNSFRAVEKAIEYEIERQEELLERKEKIIQETRGWNETKQKTFSQRTKEEAEDYRYFPEPDLPPLKITTNQILKLKSEIPELPAKKRKRFKKEYGLSEKDIEILVNFKPLGNYFEEIISELKEWEKTSLNEKPSKTESGKLIKLTANYLISELKKYTKNLEEDIRRIKITPENFAEFIILIHQGKISSTGAQITLEEMYKTGADPSHIIKEKNLTQVSDENELEKIIEEIIKNNPQPVQDYKNGKTEALQFLIGQVMKETKGRANPKIVARLFNQKLK